MRKRRNRFETPTPESIKRLADEIARKFRPKKVILFGSYASGTAREGSDVDLLIVMNTKRRPVEQAVEIRKQVDFPFAVDLLVRTPEQIEERLRLGDFFIKDILTQGKILYEADHERVGRQSRGRLSRRETRD